MSEETPEEEFKRKLKQHAEELGLTEKKVAVTIDTTSMEQMAKRLADLEATNRDLENKLLIVATKKFEEKKQQLGAPESINTVEDLREWEQAQKKADPKGAGGQATVFQAQGEPTSKSLEQLIESELPVDMMEFDNPQQLVDVLKARAQKNDKLSREYLDKLTKKGLNLVKNLGRIEFEVEATSKDLARGRGKYKEKTMESE